jgi:hypothetical protein
MMIDYLLQPGHLRRLWVSAGVRCIVTLECTEARGEGKTPSRYTTQKVSCKASRPALVLAITFFPPDMSTQFAGDFSCAEPEKHFGETGIEEVQQVFAESHGGSSPYSGWIQLLVGLQGPRPFH